jgi:hypothetical protein
MECSRTNEKIIENEYCDIFPNQVFMEEVSLNELWKKIRICKHGLLPFKMKNRKLKQIYKNYICKEKNGDDMIGMHCVDHFSL